MTRCFICGALDACEHRETELLPRDDRRGRMYAIASESTTFRKKIEKAPRDESAKTQKARARGAVKIAIDAGALIPLLKCEACDSYQFIQAHHRDYSKALEVIWLCKRCHVKADALRKIADIMPVEAVEKLIRDGSLEISAALYQLLFNSRKRLQSIAKREIDRFHNAG